MGYPPVCDQRALCGEQGDDGGAVFGVRLSFYCLCAFLFFQFYCIPVVTKGSSWTLWMSLPDVFLLLSFGFMLTSPWRARNSPDAQIVWRTLKIAIGFCMASFLFFTYLNPFDHEPRDVWVVGVNWGFFYLYRMAQIACIAWTAYRMPLQEDDYRALSRMSVFALVLASLSVATTHFSLVDTALLAPHIPNDPGTSGPWYRYHVPAMLGIGTGSIGYDHAYTGGQILLLLALSRSLAPSRNWMSGALYVLAFAGVVLSESRAGLVAFLVYSALELRSLSSGKKLLLLGAGLTLLLAFAIQKGGVSNDIAAKILERHSAILDPTQSDNISGRDVIWSKAFGYLAREKHRLVLGSGLGSAVKEIGNKAHMVYLNVLLEGGIVGLILFLYVFLTALRALGRHRPRSTSLIHGTVALLFSGMVEEFFYPVPSMGGLLALYFFGVTIVLRSGDVPLRRKEVQGGRNV